MSEAIKWLNSTDSDEWRRDNFDQINELVSVKEQIHVVRGLDTKTTCGYLYRAFLWHA